MSLITLHSSKFELDRVSPGKGERGKACCGLAASERQPRR